jgi:hypothetical protein
MSRPLVTKEKRDPVKDRCWHTTSARLGVSDYRGLEQPEKNFNLVAR